MNMGFGGTNSYLILAFSPKSSSVATTWPTNDPIATSSRILSVLTLLANLHKIKEFQVTEIESTIP